MKAYVKSKRPKPKPEEFQETIENNIEINKTTKDSSWLGYITGESYSLFPLKAEWRQRLIHDMYKFTDEEDAWEILQFCKKRKIPEHCLHDLARNDPEFKVMYDDFKKYLGLNQRLSVMKREIDKTFPVMQMHLYDKNFDEVNRYHNEMRKAVMAEANKIVNVIDYPRWPEEEQTRIDIKDENKITSLAMDNLLESKPLRDLSKPPEEENVTEIEPK